MSNEAIAICISIAALAVSGLSALYGRGQRDEAKDANRMLREQLANETKRRKDELDANRVRWVVEPTGRNSYALRHVGTEAAGDVMVRSGLVFTVGPIAPDPPDGPGMLKQSRMEPGTSIVFSVAPPGRFLQGGTADLQVSWTPIDPETGFLDTQQRKTLVVGIPATPG